MNAFASGSDGIKSHWYDRAECYYLLISQYGYIQIIGIPRAKQKRAAEQDKAAMEYEKAEMRSDRAPMRS